MESDNNDKAHPSVPRSQDINTGKPFIWIKFTNDFDSFFKGIEKSVNDDSMWNYRFDYAVNGAYWAYILQGKATKLWCYDMPVGERKGYEVNGANFADTIAKLKAKLKENKKGQLCIEDYLLQVRMEGDGCWEKKRSAH